MTVKHRTADDELDDDDGPCWCGTSNPYYSDEPYSDSCGGLGTLECYCGGDLCVCHHHGEVECPGCSDCAEGDDGLGYLPPPRPLEPFVGRA